MKRIEAFIVRYWSLLTHLSLVDWGILVSIAGGLSLILIGAELLGILPADYGILSATVSGMFVLALLAIRFVPELIGLLYWQFYGQYENQRTLAEQKRIEVERTQLEMQTLLGRALKVENPRRRLRLLLGLNRTQPETPFHKEVRKQIRITMYNLQSEIATLREDAQNHISAQDWKSALSLLEVLTEIGDKWAKEMLPQVRRQTEGYTALTRLAAIMQAVAEREDINPNDVEALRQALVRVQELMPMHPSLEPASLILSQVQQAWENYRQADQAYQRHDYPLAWQLLVEAPIHPLRIKKFEMVREEVAKARGDFLLRELDKAGESLWLYALDSLGIRVDQSMLQGIAKGGYAGSPLTRQQAEYVQLVWELIPFRLHLVKQFPIPWPQLAEAAESVLTPKGGDTKTALVSYLKELGQKRPIQQPF